jgi:hypothetical protein
MFSHHKQFWVEFNMNSWISLQFSQLISPNFLFQKNPLYSEYIIFKKYLCKCSHNQIFGLKYIII